MVGVAGVVGLAFGLLHDVGGSVDEAGDGAHETGGATGPFGVGVRHGLHDGGAVEEEADVVAPAVVVDLAAGDAVVGPVVDGPGVLVDQADGLHPGEDLVCHAGVLGVACQLVQASGQLEEEAVADGVFVVEANVIRCFADLPLQTAVTRCCVPAAAQFIPDVLGDV